MREKIDSRPKVFPGGRQSRSLVNPDLRQLRWMSRRQAAQSVIRIFPRLKNCFVRPL